MTIEEEVRSYLKKTAEDSIFYVALGKVLRRDLAAKYNLTESQVGDMLSVQAVELVDNIRNMGAGVR